MNSLNIELNNKYILFKDPFNYLRLEHYFNLLFISYFKLALDYNYAY